MDDRFYTAVFDTLNEGIYFVDRNRRITYWNKGAEKISGFTSAEVIGKRCSDNILIHVNDQGTTLCQALCPLEESITDGHPHESEAFLRHKHGHRVPVLIKTIALRDSDGTIIGGVEVFTDNSARAAFLHRIEELQRMAIVDHLTGLANRRYVEMTIEARLSERERYGWTFGMLFIDVDHFKPVNDLFGHSVGDQVLKMIAQTFINNARPFDTIGRWGGEEFVAVVVNVSEHELYQIADRMRILVEQSSVSVDSRAIKVTVSVGATLAQPGDTVEAIVERADQLMYKSKAAGRNRVTAA